jgi:hypothetical protein
VVLVVHIWNLSYLGGTDRKDNQKFKANPSTGSSKTLSFFIIAYSFFHMSIHCLGPCPLPLPLAPLTSRQNLFCPLLQFCWREGISDKKDIVFLLVWDKDSYTQRVLALLPCTSVLQLELIHLSKTSSLLPGHLCIVTSVSLRLLYSLLNSGQIEHFKTLGSLPFPIPPVCVLPLACNLCPIVLLHLFLV